MSKVKQKLAKLKELVKPKWEIAKKLGIKVAKIIAKTIRKIVVVVSMLAFIFVPFLNKLVNYTFAQWVWYPSFLIFLLSAIIDSIKNNEPTFKTPIFEFLGKWSFFAIFPIFLSIFVFNYYDIDYIWHWVVFGMVAIFVTMFLFSLLTFSWRHNECNDEEKRVSAINTIKYIILYWFLDLFYMSIFNNWLIPTFVFGVLSVTIIFFNLTHFFLYGIKFLRFIIISDFIFGLGVTTYLLYIIPDKSLQSIVSTIVAAVFGGIFTLVGVAWTIKKGDDDRKEDLYRIEDERKNEERKKHVPYIKISRETQPSACVNAHIRQDLDFESKEDRTKCQNNTIYSFKLENFDIKNISESNIIVNGIIIDDKSYKFEDTLLEKNSICRIQTTENWPILISEKIKSISLIVSDILGNEYKIKCIFSCTFDDDIGCSTETANDGEKFTYISFIYTIKNVLLPELNETRTVEK